MIRREAQVLGSVGSLLSDSSASYRLQSTDYRLSLKPEPDTTVFHEPTHLPTHESQNELRQTGLVAYSAWRPPNAIFHAHCHEGGGEDVVFGRYGTTRFSGCAFQHLSPHAAPGDGGDGKDGRPSCVHGVERSHPYGLWGISGVLACGSSQDHRRRRGVCFAD